MINYNLCAKNAQGGSPCNTYSILEIENQRVNGLLDTDKNSISTSSLQIFDCGYRIIKDNPDLWNFWNGDVFLDLDSKYAPDINSVNLNKFEKDLYDCLINHFTNNFHWLQRSGGGKSWHLAFHFNTEQFEKNEETFQKIYKFSLDKLKKAVTELGYTHWINYSNNSEKHTIFDEHNSVPTQFLHLSAYPILINTTRYINDIPFNWFGNRNDIEDILGIEIEQTYDKDIEVTSDDIVIKSDRYNINPDIDITKLGGDHDVRRRIIKILGTITNGDKEKTWKLYQPILKLIVEQKQTKHTEYQLKKLFDLQFHNILKIKQISLKTANWLKTNLDLDIEIKKVFKYVYKDSIVYDKVYTLTERQYLSKVINDIINIKTNKIIHIECGCGVGKTYSAKFLGNYQKPADIFNMNSMDGKKLRICFVTPMTSINKDNFKGEKDWIIIDSNNKHKNNAWRTSRLNVCTTWNSFLIRNMEELDFDVIMFDEIHSLYLYDYRVRDISEIKKRIFDIKDSIKNNKKIIFLTGTPGYERTEFNTYNVKVEKKESLVKTDLVFYSTKNYMGYLTEDLKNWINQSPINQAFIFNNKTSDSFVNKLEIRGIKVDTAYYKTNTEDTDYVFDNKRIRGQVAVFSVFGQSGINIYPDRPVRIYVLNTNGTEIIQYLNRVRNKEVIDKVTIFYKRDNISNTNPSMDNFSNFDMEEAKRKVDDIEKTYRTGKYKRSNGQIDDIANLFDIKRNEYKNHLWYYYFGLIYDVIDKIETYNGINRFELNDEAYKTWKLCKNTSVYENSIQKIFNRLITNYCEVNTIYQEEEKPDPIDTTLRRDTLYRQLIELNENDLSYNNSNWSFYIDSNKNQLMKLLDQRLKSDIELIINHFYDKQDTETRTKKTAIEDFLNWIQQIALKKGTVKKTDIKLYAKFLRIVDNKIYDKNAHLKIFLDYIKRSNRDELNTEDIINISAAYYGVVYNKQTESELTGLMDQLYEYTKELNKIYKEYNEWFTETEIDTDFNFNDICDKAPELVSDCKRRLIQKHLKERLKVNEEFEYINERGESIRAKDLLSLCDKIGKSYGTVKRMKKAGKIQKVNKIEENNEI